MRVYVVVRTLRVDTTEEYLALDGVAADRAAG